MISTVEKVLFLKSIELFSQIPGEDVAQIAQITDEVHYEEGDEIFSEGDAGDTMYFIIDGQVRVHQGGNDIAVLGAREVVGELAVLDSEPRSASISALSALTLLKISRDDFNEILAEKTEIARGIIKELTRRLRITTEVARSAAAEVKQAEGSGARDDSENGAKHGGRPAPPEPTTTPKAAARGQR